MKKKSSKVLFLFVVIVSVLILVSSCKKKNETVNNSTIVSNLLTSTDTQANSERNPVVVVNPPVVESTTKAEVTNSQEVKAEETNTSSSSLANTEIKVEATLVENKTEDVKAEVTQNEEAPKTEEVSSNTAVFSERVNVGDVSFLITIDDDKATVDYTPYTFADSDVIGFIEYLAENYPAIAESVSYYKEGSVVTFTYPNGYIGDDNYKKDVVSSFIILLNEYIRNSLDSTVSFTFSLNGKNVDVSLAQSRAIIKSSPLLSESEIDSYANILLSAIPELKDASYLINDKGEVVITYHEVSFEKLNEYKSEIENLINSNIALPVEKEIETVSIEEVKQENKSEEVKEQLVEPSKSEDTSTSLTEPVTEKGSFIKNFNVGLSASVRYDYKNNWIIPDFKFRAFYSISPKFALGLVTGYDMSGYIPVTVRAKYNFYDNFYLYGGVGYRFGLGVRSENSSIIIEAGIGYEYSFNEHFSMFGEIGVEYAPKSRSILTPGVTVGGSYKFWGFNGPKLSKE